MDTFVKIYKAEKENVSMLLCYDNCSEKKDPIIVLHQMLEDKESELELAYYLAREGKFVIVPDLLYHGDSQDSVKIKKKMNFNKLFVEMDKSMELIQKVITILSKDYASTIIMDNLGIMGTSYGGMLALTAGYWFKEIQYVAALCSSANWRGLIDRQTFESFRLFSDQRPVVDSNQVDDYILRYDPIYHIEEYEVKPVLIMSGGLDTTFTYKLVEPFYERLAAYYSKMNCNERLQWKKYSSSGHKVSYEMTCDLLEWIDHR